MRRRLRSLCFALASLAGGLASAQVRAPNMPGTINTDLTRQDATFVSDAGVASLGAIALAQLALERGSPEIRDVARLMLDDGEHVRDELRVIARRRGFTLPEQLLAEQQIAYDRLRTLSGKAFDKAYLVEAQKEQRNARSIFGAEAKNGHDGALRTFAGTMLPSLRTGDETASNSMHRL